MTIEKTVLPGKVIAIGLLASFFFLTSSSALMADSTMFQANLERSGVYEDAGPRSGPALAWKFDAGAAVFSTPLVYGGVVYFVDFDGGVYAVNQDDGSLLWEKNLGGQPSFQITMNEDVLLVGRLFSEEDDGSYLMAIDPESGEERWKFETDDRSGMDSPTIYNDMVFLASMSNYIFSLDLATGEEVWRHPISGGDRQPLVSNGVLYFQDVSQVIYAISPEDGGVQWSYTPPTDKHWHFSTPVIESCYIYALINGDEGSAVAKINKVSGELESEFPIEFSSMSSVSLADNVAFFGDDGGGHTGAYGYMNAMNAESGEIVWRFETEGFVRGAASIAGDTVYFGSHDHYLYAVDRHTGEKKWRYETGAGIASAPAVVDGRVYFGSIDGHVYVLE
ncbi:PQQ-binding-like beta-propeller repeat protein [Halomonas sp. ANAO-440]|uniref:outer membrane protein assembly factor BamB family protein n=1 Tax=Halomonas sp. ANAO-440 TaxID=2861360 RepID=UPI001CAA7EC6|nr:PQQ-binding-like beta-propeller repeat protein [Halomonas sp. ANAO-440]MBZ0332559.1 PQQ-binding-like beta-propeller repeat protein [Halomonas sp. ANAO-440]